MYRFAGFEFDRLRAELRGPDGKAIKLRPKTFDMLALFAANAGRIISKQELMEAVWPNVHVGEDSLFQCIRELRTALGDDQRQVIKLVSGRGYMFDVEMLAEPAAVETPAALPLAALSGEPARAVAAAEPIERRRLFGLRGPAALAAMAGLGAIVGLAVAAPIFGPDVIFGRAPPTIAVMPIAGVGSDSQVAETAANVTTRLVDGLAKIDNIRVMTQTAPQPASPLATQPDFVVNGELAKGERSWELRARMTRTATGEVVWTVPVAVSFKDSDLEEPDLGMQRSRLAAGLGHPLALRINALLEPGARTAATVGRSPGNARVAIEQAIASINQTTRERFATAQAMLEKALAEEPNNADLQVALAALQMRGIQMVWYGPDDAAAAEKNAKAMLERAVRTRPSSIPVLEAYCRFLNATNEFVESLVVCARTLAFDPWNGMALYHIGLGQLPLGRFEDALATFKQANRFDTPPVSRWTWLLGAGVSYLMMGRDEEALPWLQRSIAITPASGRPLVLLAAAYQRLGRTDEAQAALTQGLKLRPGSTVSNIGIPTKNVSAAYMEARGRIEQALIAAGLPAH
ncbi:winged helix-turn-helix domain-containing protein [Tardiphaga sp. 37S4]|uniref:winged helix-turn-helix domain-containing protein n=1 Tax=Tardiphaga sp. 37S4 TaxID=1404741 RepID=UPI001E43C985|nr:winged helix-turn-helix domain-containing protein [Tardiphaga sp. 37S4]UFS73402.1 winged helix-turn-helix domain-containing protein [Tardiphaga sp. 37S4]